MRYRVRCVLVDVDGTLCERSTDRENRARLAVPRLDVIRVVRALFLNYRVFYLSARPERDREDTLRWFKRNGVPFGQLYLRTDENEDDLDFKLRTYRDNIANDFEVIAVLEDRRRVVDAWRAAGLTVLQTAPGDF